MITKFTNAIDGEKAIMLLYGPIGVQEDGTGVDPLYFAEEMYWHKRNNRKILVKINSPGGQVFAGYAMIDAIIECEADIHVVGMAASMAGVLVQFGVVRTANDFAVLMVHAPSGGKTKGDKELTEIVRQRLADCLSKRSKLSEVQIKALMDDKEDHWYDSSEMMNKGLVDKIIVTGVKLDKNISKNISDNPRNSFKIYENIINSLSPQNQKSKKMEDSLKTLGAALKIENADESKIISAFQENATKVIKLEAEKVALEAKIKVLETSNETTRKANATKVVEAAVKAGKIEETAKQSWIDMAVLNLDAVEKSLEGMKGSFTSVSAAVEINKGAGGAVEETYEEMAKNNPAKLRNLLETNPDAYAKLEKAHLAKAQTQNK